MKTAKIRILVNASTVKLGFETTLLIFSGAPIGGVVPAWINLNLVPVERVEGRGGELMGVFPQDSLAMLSLRARVDSDLCLMSATVSRVVGGLPKPCWGAVSDGSSTPPRGYPAVVRMC